MRFYPYIWIFFFFLFAVECKQSSLDFKSNLLENQYVKVEKVRLDPESEIEKPHGNLALIYSLGNYKMEWKDDQGKTGIKTWNEGDIHVHNNLNTSAKNVGDTTAEWISFQNKDSVLPTCDLGNLENDVVKVKPEYAKVLYSDDKFKVVRVNLPAGKSIPSHSGINRAIYSLSDYTIQ